jgi:uncharacterized protein (DUF433 family)
VGLRTGRQGPLSPPAPGGYQSERTGYCIEQNPKVMTGKPVIKGTRLTVEHLLERLGDGWSEEDLLKSYPHLRPEHIRAALKYAADVLVHDRSVFGESA